LISRYIVLLCWFYPVAVCTLGSCQNEYITAALPPHPFRDPQLISSTCYVYGPGFDWTMNASLCHCPPPMVVNGSVDKIFEFLGLIPSLSQTSLQHMWFVGLQFPPTIQVFKLKQSLMEWSFKKWCEAKLLVTPKMVLSQFWPKCDMLGFALTLRNIV
jgi:hypothetical protein